MMNSQNFIFLGMRFVRRAEPSLWVQINSIISSFLGSLFLTMLLFSFLNIAPMQALEVLWIAPLKQQMYDVTHVAGLLMVCALGLTFCYQARIMNFGVQGAFLCAVYTVLSLYTQITTDFDLVVQFMLLIVYGIVAGMLWMGVLGLIHQNNTQYLAQNSIVLALLTQMGIVFMGQESLASRHSPEIFSASFNAIAIPSLRMMSLDIASVLLIALLLAGLCYWLITQSIWGLRFLARSESHEIGEYAGLSQRGAVWISLLFSGAFAGLAGSLCVLTPSLSQTLVQAENASVWGYGWGAIMVAWLGRTHPIGVVLVGAAFSVLMVGSRQAIERWHLPDSLPLLLMGLVLMVFFVINVLANFQIESDEFR